MVKDKLLQRFLRYVSFDTQSIENAGCYPSTENQRKFAEMLAEELTEIGLSNVKIDSHCYVTACLSSNSKKQIPTFGLIAHMDTSPDMPGENIKPQIVENYNSEDILLNDFPEIILKVSENPELKNYHGQTIICTDGTTLLGADDKAGIAEIITAIEQIIELNLEHGDIKIAFTPDEEIGKGVDFFDVEQFGAEFAYTLDGGQIGEIEYENFNAAAAIINISGNNVHPGYAKNKMINALNLLNEFHNLLPIEERPENTSDYEGFFHLIKAEGNVEKAELKYIIRDHDFETFEQRKNLIKQLTDSLNQKYGKNTFKTEITDQYYNMKTKVEPVFEIVEYVIEAMKLSEINPLVVPVRGGTDGARLSYMGLPCPNIFAGGHNFHSKFEYVPLESMVKAVELIINLNKIIVGKSE